MRRLLRWAFNFAAAVSAVLFVGVCVLWRHSYRAETFWHVRPAWDFVSSGGFVGFRNDPAFEGFYRQLDRLKEQLEREQKAVISFNEPMREAWLRAEEEADEIYNRTGSAKRPASDSRRARRSGSGWRQGRRRPRHEPTRW